MEKVTITKDSRIFLDLPDSENPSRFIGTLEGDTLHTDRNSKKHLFKKNHSLGFNYKLIKDGDFDFICVNYDFRRIWTSRIAVLKYGKVMHFKGKHFERQLFLPLQQFKSDKTAALRELKKLNFDDAFEHKQQLGRKLCNFAGAVTMLKQGGLF